MYYDIKNNRNKNKGKQNYEIGNEIKKYRQKYNKMNLDVRDDKKISCTNWENLQDERS